MEGSARGRGRRLSPGVVLGSSDRVNPLQGIFIQQLPGDDDGAIAVEERVGLVACRERKRELVGPSCPADAQVGSNGAALPVKNLPATFTGLQS